MRRQVMHKQDIRQPRPAAAPVNAPEAEAADLRDFFDHVAIGCHSLAEDGTILDANSAELELLGYARDEFVGRNAADFFEDHAVAADLLRRLAAGEAVRDFEARLVARDGSLIDVVIDSSVIRRHGRWVGTRGIVRDNRGRKREQEALVQRERAYQRLLESLPGAFVWTGDVAGNITYVNPLFIEFTGRTIEEIRNGEWIEAVHPDDRAHTLSEWARILATGEAHEVINRFVSRDGVARWFLTRGVPIRDELGTIVSWLATSTDIDDQKRIEEAAQLSEQRWRTLASSLPGIIGTWSPAGEPLFFNDRWFEYTGLKPEGMTAADVRGVFHPKEVTAIEELWRESLRTGTAFSVEGRIRGHDGVYRWHLGSVAPIRDDAGTIRAWISSIIDIDEAK
ncbi:MAG: PAS domain S-box protein, partial [Dehalococcoidia bacterium]